MSDAALLQRVGEVDVFAEIEPNQKERILVALRKAGNVVGYLGDGINDATALHAADVGISVESAVDVAKEAADIVLLREGPRRAGAGRAAGPATFANTLKYVFITTSANFGNMVSMAGASLFLPFLPLLPKQILLINFLTDLPSMAIATDRVDPELVERPRRWDIRFIRNFMLVFGLVSSVFDFLTFGALLLLAAGDGAGVPDRLVRRVGDDRAVHRAGDPDPAAVLPQPARHAAARRHLVVAGTTMVLPYTPLGRCSGSCRCRPASLCCCSASRAGYLLASELVKTWFFRRQR